MFRKLFGTYTPEPVSQTEETGVVVMNRREFRKLLKAYPDKVKGPITTVHASGRDYKSRDGAYVDAIEFVSVNAQAFDANIAVIKERRQNLPFLLPVAKFLSRSDSLFVPEWLFRMGISEKYRCTLTAELYRTEDSIDDIIRKEHL